MKNSAEGKVELGDMTAKKPEDGTAYVQFINREKEREKKEQEEKEKKEEEQKVKLNHFSTFALQ